MLPVLHLAALSLSLFSSPRDDRHKAVKPADLPAPYATKSADNGPQIVPQPAGVSLKLPPGFKAEVFAENMKNARWLTVAPNGDVFVAECNQNRITVLRDTTGNGVADTREVFATGLDQPFGVQFWKDYFYVANTGSIVRFKYKAGQLKADGPPETVVADIPGNGYRGHWSRDLEFNAAGTKMYVTIGSSVNIGEEDDPRRATIMEFNPDGTGGRIFASGLRNATGKAFNPKTGELWCNVNERDGLGDDLVPDYFTSVKDGGFYGWPYYYAGKTHDPRVPEKPELKAKSLEPDMLLTAHVAALGVVFYSGKMFPKEYQGDAFLALHGSGNRSKRVGYRIIRVPFKNGKCSGEWEDFLTGWMLGEDDQRVWGRPVGLGVMKDGSMLIVDDGANKIWRVSYKKP
ncbi:MAG: sorbosone dehydrogenase family protein [Chthonomonadales bacterium]